MGGGGAPFMAVMARCCPIRNTTDSNKALSTSPPLPVRWRCCSVSTVPKAPKSPPRMSTTEVPARNGRPVGPVM
ncbi:hypothetical protein SAMN02990966_03857 [Rhodospirillales bacterium URHD0017]|nr:hypothetical protein SAMN02990966_03857 [Rhodospirillales bacterium URHD0017]